MNKLRACIIGTGQEGVKSHIPGFLNCSELAEIVSVCDIDAAAAEKAAGVAGITAWHTDYLKMLKQEKPDLVSVCVPNKYHAAITINALRAGCHVFCEKPPALNAADARLMAMEADKAGRYLSYNFHYRYAPEVAVVKNMARTERFGQIYFTRVQALRRRGIPGWGNFTSKDISGGGALIDIGIHMLDSALYLLDFPQVSYVSAESSSLIGKKGGSGLMGEWDSRKFSVEDGLFGSIHFSSGAIMIIETAFTLHCEKAKQFNIDIYGENAGASVFEAKIFSLEENTLTDTSLAHLPQMDTRKASITDFTKRCTRGEAPLVTSGQGTYVMEIIDALYLSASRHEPVKL